MKNNKNLWLKKADKLWNAWVSLPGACAICGTSHSLERHHLIGKGKHLTRCHPLNGILLCSEHHRGSEFSAHMTQDTFDEWLEKNKPVQFNWKENRVHFSMNKPDFMQDHSRLKDLLGSLQLI